MIPFPAELNRNQYPALAVLDDLRRHLQSEHRCVLSAPPGAGKTTVLPLTLLNEPWRHGKILILEPRRLAALAAAGRMAALLGEPVGRHIGYRMRLATKSSRETLIEVVTDGILVRMLQEDPELKGVSAVVFDEFHERSLQNDLALALTLDAAELREDLRLLVMSATLDAEKTSAFLAAPLVQSAGRQFPVRTIYRAVAQERPLEELVADVVLHALRTETGSLLIFLPGESWIRRCVETLRRHLTDPAIRLYPLYGRLTPEEQQLAIASCREPERKIVLATSIAESSLTIDGIRIVIDSGLGRVACFDPNSAIGHLKTVRISRASADQRRGRAGRLTEGVCFRLWTTEVQEQLIPFQPPEILSADLAPLALELAGWGVKNPAELRWLDPPPPGNYRQAVALLQQLEALDRTGNLTGAGRWMLQSGLHPRLANMLLQSGALQAEGTALQLAAWLTEGDLRRLSQPDVEALLLQTDRRVAELADRLAGRLHLDRRQQRPELAGVLLSFAYPDRIAGRRDNGFLLANGRAAVFPSACTLERCRFLVVADLDGSGPTARIRLAAELSPEALERYHGHRLQRRGGVEYDLAASRCFVFERLQLGQLIISEKSVPDLPPELRRQAQLEYLKRSGLDCLNWTSALRQWRSRVQFLHDNLPEQAWPDLSDEALLRQLPTFLEPFLPSHLKKNFVAEIDWAGALHSRLDYRQRQLLEQLAPEKIRVPSGAEHRIDYSGSRPVLAVKLQELFGLGETPTILNGNVKLLLHLCSPAGRPVQITEDLKSFWDNSYDYVKAELKGRYPKHPWPDNPWQATPSAKTKRALSCAANRYRGDSE